MTAVKKFSVQFQVLSLLKALWKHAIIHHCPQSSLQLIEAEMESMAKQPDNGKKAIYGYNPTLFWVLSVSF